MKPPLSLAGLHDIPPTSRSYWVVPQRLLAGAYPGDPNPEEARVKIKRLLDAGVRSFINLQQSLELGRDGKPFACYREAVAAFCPEAVCQRFPIRDVSVPNHVRMVEILDAIDDALRADQPVYIHCWGGIGRTGTVIGCWLLRHGFARPENVLARLTTLRKADRGGGHRRSPETHEQEQFVLSWREVGTVVPRTDTAEPATDAHFPGAMR